MLIVGHDIMISWRSVEVSFFIMVILFMISWVTTNHNGLTDHDCRLLSYDDIHYVHKMSSQSGCSYRSYMYCIK